MVNKKVYIVLIIIILALFIGLFYFYGIKRIKEEKYTTTLIIGNTSIWSQNKKNWFNIRDNGSINKLNWEKYKVYSDNKNIGEYSLWHDDKWYVFDENKNSIELDGNLLAIKSNHNINVLPFSIKDVNNSDMKNVYTVLKDNNLSTDNEFTALYKTLVDYDNDGVKEEFYIVTNAFPMGFRPNYIFSFAFMVKNDSIYYIYKDVSQSRAMNGCKPFYNSFLDLDEDNNYEFILSCGKFGSNNQVDMLYKFEENAFKVIFSNQ